MGVRSVSQAYESPRRFAWKNFSTQDERGQGNCPARGSFLLTIYTPLEAAPYGRSVRQSFTPLEMQGGPSLFVLRLVGAVVCEGATRFIKL